MPPEPEAHAVEEPGLFDVSPYRVDAAPPTSHGEAMSAGRKLTARQRTDIARGRHPLTSGPLHAEAAPAEPHDAPGRRCGNCAFRELKGHGDRSYPKCVYGGGLRVTSGAASDVRRWWPACTEHQPAGETG